MNKVILLGRLAKEPELGMTQGGVPVCKFTVACDRKYSKGDEKQTDFIRCVAWRQTAEFIHKYFGKGQRIALEGSITTGSYDDDSGRRHYITEVTVDNAEFAQSKGEGQASGSGTTHRSFPTGNAAGESFAQKMGFEEFCGKPEGLRVPEKPQAFWERGGARERADDSRRELEQSELCDDEYDDLPL